MALDIIKDAFKVNPIIMEQEIMYFLDKNTMYQWEYIKINDDYTLKIVYDLLIHSEDKLTNEIIFQDPLLCYYYGIYHHHKRSIWFLKKYYINAIKHGIAAAMDALGYHYYQWKNYEKAKKYYLMAIEQGNKRSMYNIAEYYRDDQDYEHMEEYYLMAINQGHVKSMYRLAEYYEMRGKFSQLDMSNHYYRMAAKHGDINSIIRLSQHYESDKKYQQMEIYYLMAIKRDFDIYLPTLSDYYYRSGRIDEMIQYNLMMIEKYNNKTAWNVLTNKYQDNLVELLDLINLHRDIKKRKEKKNIDNCLLKNYL